MISGDSDHDTDVKIGWAALSFSCCSPGNFFFDTQQFLELGPNGAKTKRRGKTNQTNEQKNIQ